MAKRRKKGGRKRRTIRIGATVGMIGAAAVLWGEWKARGSTRNGAVRMVRALTGYDIDGQTWDYKNATAGMCMIGGVGLSFVASKVGLNRYTPTGINI